MTKTNQEYTVTLLLEGELAEYTVNASTIQRAIRRLLARDGFEGVPHNAVVMARLNTKPRKPTKDTTQ